MMTNSMITRPFPFNAYYSESEVREVEESSYRLEVTGMVADKRKWSLPELRALPQIDQVTRHICVEGWSAIGKWGGVSFSSWHRPFEIHAPFRFLHWRSESPIATRIFRRGSGRVRSRSLNGFSRLA